VITTSIYWLLFFCLCWFLIYTGSRDDTSNDNNNLDDQANAGDNSNTNNVSTLKAVDTNNSENCTTVDNTNFNNTAPTTTPYGAPATDATTATLTTTDTPTTTTDSSTTANDSINQIVQDKGTKRTNEKVSFTYFTVTPLTISPSLSLSLFLSPSPPSLPPLPSTPSLPPLPRPTVFVFSYIILFTAYWEKSKKAAHYFAI
jgi:hypothetical protein